MVPWSRTQKFLLFWLCWAFLALPRLFSSCGEPGLLFLIVHGFLIAVASLVRREKIPLMPAMGGGAAEFLGAAGRIWLLSPSSLEKYKQGNLNLALE